MLKLFSILFSMCIISSNALSTTPFTKIINKIDLNNINDNDVKDLKMIFKCCPLIVFKNQNITPEKQLEICKIFDENSNNEICHPFTDTTIPKTPQIAIRGCGYIEDIYGIKNTNIINSDTFKFTPVWHQDLVGTHEKLPSVVSSMYMIETPIKGGSTLFANLEKGYENLDKYYNLKKIEDLECVYSSYLSLSAVIDYTGYGRVDKYWETYNNIKDKEFKDNIKNSFVTQPFVIYSDKDSTKKSLMISPNKLFKFKSRKNGYAYTPEVSQEIMRSILNKCVFVDDNIEEIKYEKNDLVIFNNRKLIHSSTPVDDIVGNRFMTLLFLGTNEEIVSKII